MLVSKLLRIMLNSNLIQPMLFLKCVDTFLNILCPSVSLHFFRIGFIYCSSVLLLYNCFASARIIIYDIMFAIFSRNFHIWCEFLSVSCFSGTITFDAKSFQILPLSRTGAFATSDPEKISCIDWKS